MSGSITSAAIEAGLGVAASAPHSTGDDAFAALMHLFGGSDASANAGALQKEFDDGQTVGSLRDLLVPSILSQHNGIDTVRPEQAPEFDTTGKARGSLGQGLYYEADRLSRSVSIIGGDGQPVAMLRDEADAGYLTYPGKLVPIGRLHRDGSFEIDRDSLAGMANAAKAAPSAPQLNDWSGSYPDVLGPTSSGLAGQNLNRPRSAELRQASVSASSQSGPSVMHSEGERPDEDATAATPATEGAAKKADGSIDAQQMPPLPANPMTFWHKVGRKQAIQMPPRQVIVALSIRKPGRRSSSTKAD